MKKFKYAIKLSPLFVGEIEAKNQEEAKNKIKKSLKKIKQKTLKNIQFVGDVDNISEVFEIEQ